MLRPPAILLLTALAVVVPASALAAPPPYVTGLRAAVESGREVRVKWDPSPDRNVVKYRVYYSSASILESGGIYDDYEETSGPEPVYVFVDPPAVDRLYVTVLAVNAQGEESAAFVEEVFVELGAKSPPPELVPPASTPESPASSQTPAPTSSARSEPDVLLPLPSSSGPGSPVNVPTWQAPPEDGKLHLLLAESLSPTQVRLTLSHEPVITPENAPQAFRITDAAGKQLAIRQMVIDGTIVTMDTDIQTKGMVYEVQLSEPLVGHPDLPLDPTDRRAFFTGHTEGAAVPDAGLPPSGNPGVPRDVDGFRLRAAAQADGTFTVTGQWQGVPAADIVAILLRQSLDGGRTFTEPQVLPSNIGGIQMNGVHPGQLTIALHTVNAHGRTSRGVMDTIVLPGIGSPEARSIPQPPVARQEILPSDIVAPPSASSPHADRLPGTGAAGLAMIGTSFVGAGLGLRRARALQS